MGLKTWDHEPVIQKGGGMHTIQAFLTVFLCGFFWLTIILSLALAQEITIYDEHWRVKERIRDGTIYDRDWKVKGHIENGRVYDRSWNIEKRIEGGKIYDRNWNQRGLFDDERIYDRNWNTKGYIRKK